MILSCMFMDNAVPEIGDHFTYGCFTGECIDRIDHYDEDGELFSSDVIMESQQKPMCNLCRHGGAYTTDDIRACDWCSVGTDGAEDGCEYCNFLPYDPEEWLAAQ